LKTDPEILQNPLFRIAYDGAWYHDGALITRAALAKLFSDRALNIDAEGGYWLKTPHEQYPVEVEDVPFVIVDYKVVPGGYDLMTNMDEIIEVGPKNPLFLRRDKVSGDELPYIEVRAGLLARLSRGVYYNLVEECGAALRSRGGVFPLGFL
jgi:hypothetical protein